MKIYELSCSSDGGNYEPYRPQLIIEDLGKIKEAVMNIITEEDFIPADHDYQSAYKVTTWENGRAITGFYIHVRNKMETLEWIENYE